MDLTLAAHGAVAWRYRFADDALTWFSDGLDRLLFIRDANAESLRSRLRQLLEPLIVSAATAQDWRELELEQPFEDRHGVQHRLRVRARPVGQRHPEELIGIATDAHPYGEEIRQLAILADRYRLLAELSPDAICVATRFRNVVYCSSTGSIGLIASQTAFE